MTNLSTSHFPVFVFGSNLAGRHGKGAAKFAQQNCGAIYGRAEGRQGNSYAIPTKTKNLGFMKWEEIDPAIERFCAYARKHEDEFFQLTPIGCGLAGHSIKSLISSLKTHKVPNNVFLTSSWLDHFPLIKEDKT